MGSNESGNEVRDDPDLLAAVRGGDRGAFGELFRRHASAARRLACAMTHSVSAGDEVVSDSFERVFTALCAGKGPDVAFRPYLLRTVRNSVYEHARRDGRISPTDDEAVFDGPVVDSVLPERSVEDSVVAEAFRALPERWRAVLWGSVVEGQSTSEIARQTGVSPTAVTSLVGRAKEGFRRQFLQAHVSRTQAVGCRTTAENLGAWSRGGLPKRDRALVDDHLSRCASCRNMAAELSEVNSHLRAVIAPVIIGGAALVYLSSTPTAPHPGSTHEAADHAAAGGAKATIAAPGGSSAFTVSGVFSATGFLAVAALAAVLIGGSAVHAHGTTVAADDADVSVEQPAEFYVSPSTENGEIPSSVPWSGTVSSSSSVSSSADTTSHAQLPPAAAPHSSRVPHASNSATWALTDGPARATQSVGTASSPAQPSATTRQPAGTTSRTASQQSAQTLADVPSTSEAPETSVLASSVTMSATTTAAGTETMEPTASTSGTSSTVGTSATIGTTAPETTSSTTAATPTTASETPDAPDSTTAQSTTSTSDATPSTTSTAPETSTTTTVGTAPFSDLVFAHDWESDSDVPQSELSATNQVRNNSTTAPSVEIALVADVPQYVTVTLTTPGGTCSSSTPGQLTCRIGSIPPGGSVDVAVDAFAQPQLVGSASVTMSLIEL